MRFLYSILLFGCLIVNDSYAQSNNDDSLFIRKIYDEVLSNGYAYDDLRSLCKDVGARLSGSSEAEMAVIWGKQKLDRFGFDSVYLQEVMVPHWERGTAESAWYSVKNGERKKVKILALGGSIGTNGLLSADLVIFKHIDELIEAKEADVTGKIVLLNQPMDEKQINTFRSYGACYPLRNQGAVEAAKKGAVAVIIRSLAMPIDDHPHTGSMHYDDDVKKIPAAALSTRDCELIAQESVHGALQFHFEMDCRNYPDVKSYNVIAELRGSEKPNEYITFGGHLDSWDTGEGAHDDGAGIVHAMEALRVLKSLNYRPKHSLRAVFFMNEENGNMGGKTYAKQAIANKEKHIAAIESDRGGFSPRGFHCDGNEQQVDLLRSFAPSFKPYELLEFDKGYGGVDISPLKGEYEGIPLFGLVPDSQRYFDFHHAESDVFENVNKRELELGAGALASLVYLLDQNL